MNRIPIAYEGAEPYIFVSYAHKNASEVLRILCAMQENGFRLWFDQGIEAGTEWPEYIEKHLVGCERVLVFLSNAAVASVNCRNEINLALALKKEVLIVYLEETTLRHGLLLQLSSVQALFSYRHTSDTAFYKELFAARLLSVCKDGTAAPKTTGKNTAVPSKKDSKRKKGISENTLTAKKETSEKNVSEKKTATLTQNNTDTAPPKKKTVAAPAYTLRPDASKNLEFMPVNGGKSYFVSGIGTCRDSSIVIPALHNGLPVTGCTQNAFKTAAGIISLSIPESFKGIPMNTFEYHMGLMEVTVAGGVKTIGDWAFRKSAVVRVTLDEGIKSIGSYAFLECGSLTSLALPDTLTQIGKSAFSDCKALTHVSIPKGVKFIPENAFFLCSSLESVAFSDSVTEIGEDAFAFCSSLSEIQFPKKLKTISAGAFSRCHFSQLAFPSGLTTIGPKAFSDSVMLERIHLPATIRSIGANAFTASIYRPESWETEVSFDGTLAQWKAILKAPSWCEKSGIRTVHCIDGDDVL